LHVHWTRSWSDRPWVGGLRTCDVCLSWHTREQTAAMISAAVFELPVATVLAAGAVTVIRRTSRTVAGLRGRTELPRSF
jgi:hypothetical protein